MKVLVPIKRVVDYNVKVRVKSDESGVDIENVKMAMNPFDEIATEEALRLKEKGLASEVIAVSVGTSASQDVLRNAMAMGADRSILVKYEEESEPLLIAKILKSIVAKEEAKLIILGKQAIDDDANQTAQMLAALLGWPQGTFASNIAINNDNLEVVREVSGGLETVRMKLPAVISADLRLNEPRFATLPNIIKAKKKLLDVISFDELGISHTLQLKAIKFVEPPKRKVKCQIMENASELVNQLKNVDKVIS